MADPKRLSHVHTLTFEEVRQIFARLRSRFISSQII